MRSARVEAEVVIKLEVNEDEATILRALLGNIRGSGKVRESTRTMWLALNEVIPDREETFGHFFLGEVAVKP